MSLPIPNLDDKTFEELFEEARSLIPRYAPEWTDHNFSDPGITFIDLFAWLTEMQIYSLNRITNKHYLKFLKLICCEPQVAIPAKTDVTFSFKSKIAKKSTINILQGTQVCGTDAITGKKFVFETDEDLNVVDLNLKAVLTWEEGHWLIHTKYNEESGVFYYPFGKTAKQNNKLFLGFEKIQSDIPAEEIKLTINLFEIDLPKAAELPEDEKFRIFPSATLEWDYWNGVNWRRLEVIDDTMSFTKNGRVVFTVPDDFAITNLKDEKQNMPLSIEKLYWIRVTISQAGHEISPRVDRILLNTISATHRQTFKEEIHSGKGLVFRTLELKHKPVLRGTLELQIIENDNNWHKWHQVTDLDSSGPEDCHYTIDLVNGILIFGDGVNGRIPPIGEDNIRIVRYGVGGGEIGNVQANFLSQIKHPSFSQLSVENRYPATGGKDAETLEEAKQRARRQLKKRFRTVTTSDFEKLVFSTPRIRIARVKVLPLYHPKYTTIKMPGAVTVVVVPYALPDSTTQLPIPSDGFLKTVISYIEQKRVATTNLHVIRPEFIEIIVNTTVNIDPRMKSDDMKLDIEKALTTFLHPLQGGKDRSGWPFGRTVFKSEIYEVIEKIEGVTCVNSVLLSSNSCLINDENIKIPRIGLVYSGKHCIRIN